MKLKQYLKANNLTQHKFIEELEKRKLDIDYRKVDCLSTSALLETPRKDEMVAIYDFTNNHGEGRVEPNDFYLE